MSALETLILGIIQGLTEFLPVSSSGHLEIVKAIFGSDYDQKEGLLVTITLHSATAFSTIFVFRKEIALILTDLLQFKKGESFDFSSKILLSMIPAVIIGLFFEDFIASLFKGKIAFVGGMLFITAFLLYFADKVSQNCEKLSKPSVEYKFDRYPVIVPAKIGAPPKNNAISVCAELRTSLSDILST